MSTGSSIEWTEATWNPVVGCTPVSPGCLNCYAAALAPRLGRMGQEVYVGLTVRRDERHVFNGTVRCLPDRLTGPLRWRKPRRIFVDSMSDLFHEAVPFDFVDRVMAIASMCPRHTFQILTKRSGRMAEFYARRGVSMSALCEMLNHAPKGMTMAQTCLNIKDGTWMLPNVWLGVSCENQATADERIPHLLKCPAAVRFLSCEPLIGPIDLRLNNKPDDLRTRAPYIGWVIVGGESGPNSRPCDVAWIRSIVEQCKDAGVPVFVKQLGAKPMRGMLGPDEPIKLADSKGGNPAEWAEDLRVRQMPEVARG